MAPVKISYVVSFSSQDPKFPVENLLREDEPRPWLGCPRDRSRRLHVELQLERASPIGYVDIGNCGCAFLQIEVGRSSWPHDRPFLTLLPSVVLMTPAQSKLGQNRCGVRMFKEDAPWCSSPAFRRTFFPEPHSYVPGLVRLCPLPTQPGLGPLEVLSPSTGTDGLSVPRTCGEEQQLRSRLQQLEPDARSPARLSRPAQMVLSAARSRARRPRTSTGALGGHPELPPGDLGGPTVPAALALELGHRSCDKQGCHSVSWHVTGCHAASGTFGEGGSLNPALPREPGPPVSPPLPAGRFSLELLPTHAAGCGEEEPEAARPSSPPGGSWVSCPLCQLLFTAAEVEQHASTCGEETGTAGTPSHC
ncbi:XRCC1 protein, partial [Alopecoenas beccarii]|nr:XRCC1 protein [Alopecoenas beccarii]